MNKALIATALTSLLGILGAQVALADNLAKFDGGIGVVPTGSANTLVRGVSPAGQIWVIKDLHAEVKDDGRILVHGRGLLLGSGNNVGGNANASVFATLICEADPPFVERNSALTGVPLEPDGDFRIDDMLTPAPVECASPVLLIRNATNLAWFAAGIPRH
jgi:hypothetical protein